MDFSVVIPTRNKPQYLALTLAGLCHQSQSITSYEVIVVNDGQSPLNQVIADTHALNPSIKLREICTNNRGNLSAARNIGFRAAEGAICIFLDDDMIPVYSFISSYARKFEHDFDVVRGSYFGKCVTIWQDFNDLETAELLGSGNPRLVSLVETQPHSIGSALLTPLEIALHRDYFLDLTYFHRYGPAHEYPDLSELEMPWLLGGGNNVAYRRTLLNTIDGFDEEYQGWGLEDLEAAYRADLIRAKFGFEGAAFASHQHHAKDWTNRTRSAIANWSRFTRSHGSIEVWLWFFWRIYPAITLEQYNLIIRHYRRRAPEAVSLVNELVRCLDFYNDPLPLSEFHRRVANIVKLIPKEWGVRTFQTAPNN